jgi:hypothetical protein
LVPLVEPPLRIERKRMRRDGLPCEEMGAEIHYGLFSH